jgi:hypothetical protein
MALRRCLRTDFLLGFRHQIADALDCVSIELLGPSIGGQSPFDEALSHRPSDQSNQRPRDERASADRYATRQDLRLMAPPSLSFGISLRQYPAELFEERDLEFESVFLQRRVCEPSLPPWGTGPARA